jgi:beta-lactamase class A
MKKTRVIAAAFALVCAGGAAGWFAHASLAPSLVYKGTVIRDNAGGYSLIDPILACDVGPQEAFPELDPIKQSLQDTITAEVKAGGTQTVSIYLRLLKSGKWFDINPNMTYAPASLLKVFIMTSYYKENEDYPGTLDKQLSYEGSSNPADDDPGEVIPHLTSGKLYSVRDIIKQMIIYSDNDAFNTLVDNFDAHTLEDFNNIFTDLNIPSPATQSENDLQFMNVSAYATIFRVLYGATYLSSTDSETALALLADAQYKDGIVAGVPGGTEVAHKFGVRSIPATATTSAASELHDCGIVYYPTHPYLLCIMTQGSNFASLQGDLQQLSKTAYQAINAYYAGRPAATSTPAK